MASLIKIPTKVFLNGAEVAGVRSVDIRLAVNEVQQATVVLFCNDIQIAEDGSIFLMTSEET